MAKTPAKAVGNGKAYRCVHSIVYGAAKNGLPGDVVSDMTDEDAEYLLANGAITEEGAVPADSDSDLNA